MLLLFAALSIADAQTVAVPGTDLMIHLPESDPDLPPPWSYRTMDVSSEVKVGMRNIEAFTDIRLSTTSYQPEVAAVSEDLLAWLESEDEADPYEEYSIGELVAEEHEKLGPLLRVPFEVADTHLEQTFYREMVFFGIEGAGVVVTAISSDSAERANTVLSEVVEMMDPMKPALADEDLPTGKVQTPSGFSVELPVGWRALTDGERDQREMALIKGTSDYAGEPASFFVVDTQYLNKTPFFCRVNDAASLHVLDPNKSSAAVENFKTYGRVFLKGGQFRLTEGGDSLVGDSLPEKPLDIQAEDDVEFFALADRDAYLWRVSGAVFDEPVSASLFFTTYDDLGLTCVAHASEGDEAILGTFEGVMRGLEILDGENHPMALSMGARYTRWWPFSNPLMQLYFFPIPLLAFGAWFVYKSD
jgi:hypothetical protein